MTHVDHTIDESSGLPIRATDNGLKEGDLGAVQITEPLKLNEDGVPKGWEAPDGDR